MTIDMHYDLPVSVSRETAAKLDWLVNELKRWQSVKNLVGVRTIDDIWTRHVVNSLQLPPLVARPGTWIDLGSGGGFPGLIVALQRTEAGLGTTRLIEANHRKCAFLLHCIRKLSLDAVVHTARIEHAGLDQMRDVVAVSARALASLDQLISWSIGLLRNGAVGIFPKGQDVERELREAATSWDFAADLHPSITDPDARIVVLRMGSDQELPHVC